MLDAHWLSAFLPVGIMNANQDWEPTGAGVLSSDPGLPAALPPLHLGVATSADAVLALIQGDAARSQIEIAVKQA